MVLNQSAFHLAKMLEELQNHVDNLPLPTVPQKKTGGTRRTYLKPESQPEVNVAKQKSMILQTESWLRKLGIYGSYSSNLGLKNHNYRRIRVGVNLPLIAKTLFLEIQSFGSQTPWDGIYNIPIQLQIQNQVPLKSPFMDACARGDIDMIQQGLCRATGHVGDRTMCMGKTPLLVRSFLIALG